MLMLTVIGTLSFLLFVFTVLLPVNRCNKVRVQRESRELYRTIQLLAVREWYPEASNLSLSEIAEKYNVDEAYRRIR